MLIVKVGDKVRLIKNPTIRGVVTYTSDMTQSALVAWDFMPQTKYTSSSTWHNFSALEIDHDE